MDYILGLLYATKRFERREHRRHISPSPSSPLSVPSREVRYLASSITNANENINVNTDATNSNIESSSELSPECGTSSTITIPPLRIYTSSLRSDKQKGECDNEQEDNATHTNIARRLRIGESATRVNKQCICTDTETPTSKLSELSLSSPSEVPLCTNAHHTTNTHLEKTNREEEGTTAPIQVIGSKQIVVNTTTTPSRSINGRDEMEKMEEKILKERRNAKSVITANISESMNSVASNNLDSPSKNYFRQTDLDSIAKCTSVPIAELANKFILVYLPSPYAVFENSNDDNENNYHDYSNDYKSEEENNKNNKLCYCPEEGEESGEEEEEEEEYEEQQHDDDDDDDDGVDINEDDHHDEEEKNGNSHNKVRQTSLSVETENEVSTASSNKHCAEENKNNNNNDKEIASNLHTHNNVNVGSNNSKQVNYEVEKVRHTSKNKEDTNLPCSKSSCKEETQESESAALPLLARENTNSDAPISSAPHNPLSHSPQPLPPLSEVSAVGATRLVEHDINEEAKEEHMSTDKHCFTSSESPEAATALTRTTTTATASATSVKEVKTNTKELTEPVLIPPLALSSAFTSLHDMLEQHASRSPLHSHHMSGMGSSFTNPANVGASSSSISAPTLNTTAVTDKASGTVLTTNTTTSKANTLNTVPSSSSLLAKTSMNTTTATNNSTRSTSKQTSNDQHYNSAHHKGIKNNYNNNNGNKNDNYTQSGYASWRVECAERTYDAQESELVEQHLLAFYCSLLHSLQSCNIKNRSSNYDHDNAHLTEKGSRLSSSTSHSAEKLLHTLQLLTSKRMSSVAILEVRHTRVNRECAVISSMSNSSHITSSTLHQLNSSYHSPQRQNALKHDGREKKSPLLADHSTLKLENDKVAYTAEWQNSKNKKVNAEETKKAKEYKSLSAETSTQEQNNLAADNTKLIPVLHIPVKELVTSSNLQLTSMASEDENKNLTKSPTIHLSTNFTRNLQKTPQSDSHSIKALCNTSQISSSSLSLSPHSNVIMKRSSSKRKLHSSRHTIERAIYNLLFHSHYIDEWNGHSKEVHKNFYFDDHEELYSNPLYGGWYCVHNGEAYRRLAQLYNCTRWPTFFLLDANGVVIMNEHELMQLMNKELAKYYELHEMHRHHMQIQANNRHINRMRSATSIIRVASGVGVGGDGSANSIHSNTSTERTGGNVKKESDDEHSDEKGKKSVAPVEPLNENELALLEVSDTSANTTPVKNATPSMQSKSTETKATIAIEEKINSPTNESITTKASTTRSSSSSSVAAPRKTSTSAAVSSLSPLACREASYMTPERLRQQEELEEKEISKTFIVPPIFKTTSTSTTPVKLTSAKWKTSKCTDVKITNIEGALLSETSPVAKDYGTNAEENSIGGTNGSEDDTLSPMPKLPYTARPGEERKTIVSMSELHFDSENNGNVNVNVGVSKNDSSNKYKNENTAATFSANITQEQNVITKMIEVATPQLKSNNNSAERTPLSAPVPKQSTDNFVSDESIVARSYNNETAKHLLPEQEQDIANIVSATSSNSNNVKITQPILEQEHIQRPVEEEETKTEEHDEEDELTTSTIEATPLKNMPTTARYIDPVQSGNDNTLHNEENDATDKLLTRNLISPLHDEVLDVTQLSTPLLPSSAVDTTTTTCREQSNSMATNRSSATRQLTCDNGLLEEEQQEEQDEDGYYSNKSCSNSGNNSPEGRRTSCLTPISYEEYKNALHKSSSASHVSSQSLERENTVTVYDSVVGNTISEKRQSGSVNSLISSEMLSQLPLMSSCELRPTSLLLRDELSNTPSIASMSLSIPQVHLDLWKGNETSTNVNKNSTNTKRQVKRTVSSNLVKYAIQDDISMSLQSLFEFAIPCALFKNVAWYEANKKEKEIPHMESYNILARNTHTERTTTYLLLFGASWHPAVRQLIEPVEDLRQELNKQSQLRSDSKINNNNNNNNNNNTNTDLHDRDDKMSDRATIHALATSEFENKNNSSRLPHHNESQHLYSSPLSLHLEENGAALYDACRNKVEEEQQQQQHLMEELTDDMAPPQMCASFWEEPGTLNPESDSDNETEKVLNEEEEQQPLELNEKQKMEIKDAINNQNDVKANTQEKESVINVPAIRGSAEINNHDDQCKNNDKKEGDIVTGESDAHAGNENLSNGKDVEMADKLSNINKEIKVVFVSLDRTKDEWCKTMQMLPHEWWCVCPFLTSQIMEGALRKEHESVQRSKESAEKRQKHETTANNNVEKNVCSDNVKCAQDCKIALEHAMSTMKVTTLPHLPVVTSRLRYSKLNLHKFTVIQSHAEHILPSDPDGDDFPWGEIVSDDNEDDDEDDDNEYSADINDDDVEKNVEDNHSVGEVVKRKEGKEEDEDEDKINQEKIKGKEEEKEEEEEELQLQLSNDNNNNEQKTSDSLETNDLFSTTTTNSINGLTEKTSATTNLFSVPPRSEVVPSLQREESPLLQHERSKGCSEPKEHHKNLPQHYLKQRNKNANKKGGENKTHMFASTYNARRRLRSSGKVSCVSSSYSPSSAAFSSSRSFASSSSLLSSSSRTSSSSCVPFAMSNLSLTLSSSLSHSDIKLNDTLRRRMHAHVNSARYSATSKGNHKRFHDMSRELLNSKSDIALNNNVKDSAESERSTNDMNSISNRITNETNEVDKCVAETPHETIHPFVRLFTLYETNLPRLLENGGVFVVLCCFGPIEVKLHRECLQTLESVAAEIFEEISLLRRKALSQSNRSSEDICYSNYNETNDDTTNNKTHHNANREDKDNNTIHHECDAHHRTHNAQSNNDDNVIITHEENHRQHSKPIAEFKRVISDNFHQLTYSTDYAHRLIELLPLPLLHPEHHILHHEAMEDNTCVGGCDDDDNNNKTEEHQHYHHNRLRYSTFLERNPLEVDCYFANSSHSHLDVTNTFHGRRDNAQHALMPNAHVAPLYPLNTTNASAHSSAMMNVNSGNIINNATSNSIGTTSTMSLHNVGNVNNSGPCVIMHFPETDQAATHKEAELYLPSLYFFDAIYSSFKEEEPQENKNDVNISESNSKSACRNESSVEDSIASTKSTTYRNVSEPDVDENDAVDDKNDTANKTTKHINEQNNTLDDADPDEVEHTLPPDQKYHTICNELLLTSEATSTNQSNVSIEEKARNDNDNDVVLANKAHASHKLENKDKKKHKNKKRHKEKEAHKPENVIRPIAYDNTDEEIEMHNDSIPYLQEYLLSSIIEEDKTALPTTEGEPFLLCVRLPQRKAAVMKKTHIVSKIVIDVNTSSSSSNSSNTHNPSSNSSNTQTAIYNSSNSNTGSKCSDASVNQRDNKTYITGNSDKNNDKVLFSASIMPDDVSHLDKDKTQNDSVEQVNIAHNAVNANEMTNSGSNYDNGEGNNSKTIPLVECPNPENNSQASSAATVASAAANTKPLMSSSSSSSPLPSSTPAPSSTWSSSNARHSQSCLTTEQSSKKTLDVPNTPPQPVTNVIITTTNTTTTTTDDANGKNKNKETNQAMNKDDNTNDSMKSVITDLKSDDVALSHNTHKKSSSTESSTISFQSQRQKETAVMTEPSATAITPSIGSFPSIPMHLSAHTKINDDDETKKSKSNSECVDNSPHNSLFVATNDTNAVDPHPLSIKALVKEFVVSQLWPEREDKLQEIEESL